MAASVGATAAGRIWLTSIEGRRSAGRGGGQRRGEADLGAREGGELTTGSYPQQRGRVGKACRC
jgi:hypothetical protein